MSKQRDSFSRKMKQYAIEKGKELSYHPKLTKQKDYIFRAAELRN